MTANELADELDKSRQEPFTSEYLVGQASTMLRKQQAEIERLKALNTIKDAGILTVIKLIADDISGYKDYENTYADGWLDACNTVYDDVFAILRKAQEK
jgi:hypothetical protein